MVEDKEPAVGNRGTGDPSLDAVMDLFNLKRLLNIGGSWAVVLPRAWVDYVCEDMEGRRLVELCYSGKEIHVRGITAGDIEELRQIGNIRASS